MLVGVERGEKAAGELKNGTQGNGVQAAGIGAGAPGRVTSNTQHPTPKPDETFERWTQAAEALRRCGWREDDVRRVLQWARSLAKNPADEWLYRLVAAGLQTQHQARKAAEAYAQWHANPGRKPDDMPARIQDWPRYLIGWQTNEKLDREKRLPGDEWLRAGRKAFDRPVQVSDLAAARWNALFREWFAVQKSRIDA